MKMQEEDRDLKETYRRMRLGIEENSGKRRGNSDTMKCNEMGQSERVSEVTFLFIYSTTKYTTVSIR
jgi:hypothetical protein